MPWIAKIQYSFNKYIGKDGIVVNSVTEAKEFKTKKEAIEFISKTGQKNPTELLKVTRNK